MAKAEVMGVEAAMVGVMMMATTAEAVTEAAARAGAGMAAEETVAEAVTVA